MEYLERPAILAANSIFELLEEQITRNMYLFIDDLF